MRLLTTIATMLAQHHRFTATLRELDACSDRELVDMGLARSDLARLAREDAERRFPLPAEPSARPFAKADARSIALAFAGQR